MKVIKALLIILLVLVIILGGIIATFFFMTGAPSSRVVDTQWTEADFNSYLAKGGIDFDENHASAEDMIAGNFRSSGEVPVDTVVTNEELTAAANMAMNDNSIMKDIAIKCKDGSLEMSCVIGDLGPIVDAFPQLEKYKAFLGLVRNKPIYMDATLSYNKATGLFEGVTEELYVGKIKIPVKQANDSLEDAGTALNNALQGLAGFSVNDFKVTPDGFDFDGTIPEKIESAGPLAGF